MLKAGWLITQQIAHLKNNALQQLYSYFVSTMPRPYDRQLISDALIIIIESYPTTSAKDKG